MGVTQDLCGRLEELRQVAGWRRLVHPELLHIEQHDDQVRAHQRLQDLRHRWRNHSVWHAFPSPDPLAITSGVIRQVSPH